MKGKNSNSKPYKKGNFKKYGKSNGRSNAKRSNGYSKDVDANDMPMKGSTNNPAWYGGNQLAKSSANIFFTKPFGTVIDIDPNNSIATACGANPLTKFAAPGVMVLKTTPAMGKYAFLDSPVNIAAQAMYSFIRHANSGSRNYDAPDLITYMLAMAEVYSAISEIQRLYGLINRYYPENRYFARHIVTAMGYDYDSFAGNMAQFNYWINTVIAKATAFAVPSDIPFFSRRFELYKNVYAEDESIKDQMYIFVPTGFYQYTIDNNYPEAYLKFVSLSLGVPVTFSQLQYVVDGLIQNLLTSEDIGIVSGDIIKAYGREGLIKLAQFPTEYIVDPVVHDYNILFQIRNASIVENYKAPDVHQDSTKVCLEWDNEINYGTTGDAEVHSYLSICDNIITSNSADSTAEEVLESTRLMATASNYDYDGTNYLSDLVCGTEIITQLIVARFKQQYSDVVPILSTYTYSSNKITFTNVLNILMTSFKYHPTFYCFSWTPNSPSSIGFNGIYQDLDNIAVIDEETLSNIHQTAIMNMLAVPAIGKL